MRPADPIFVAGHRGMVGAAIVRALRAAGFTNLLLRSRAELDLRRQADVQQFFAAHKPAAVVIAAAKVGGILANNTLPAEFIHDNLAIQTNIIDSAYRHGASKLLFLGSSCVYPRLAPQPITEDSLLSGPLETTNEWYAIAKIAGIKMCEAYRRQYGFNAITAMPTNLYGPEDNFDLTSSHVLPALLRKFHEAAQRGSDSVEVWGTGSPRREFLHVDDLAAACVFLMQKYDTAGWINIGTGTDLTIAELAQKIARVTGFKGPIRFDSSKPDGTPRKVLDTSRMAALGWSPRIDLDTGLRSTYNWYLEHTPRGT
jgi:GDP-L-fucose synthase